MYTPEYMGKSSGSVGIVKSVLTTEIRRPSTSPGCFSVPSGYQQRVSLAYDLIARVYVDIEQDLT